MTHAAVQEHLTELLEQYSKLTLDEGFDVKTLESLMAQRQEIIDQIIEIDESLALVREAIEERPSLQKLLVDIADLDRELLDQAMVYKEQLHSSLSHTGRGLQAARGYRLYIPSSPAIIDKTA